MTTLTATQQAYLSEPMTVASLGLDRGVLLDLTLKTLFYRGRMTRSELSEELKLSGAVMQEVLQAVTQDGLASVLGSEGTGPAGYMYALTQKGLDRSRLRVRAERLRGPGAGAAAGVHREHQGTDGGRGGGDPRAGTAGAAGARAFRRHRRPDRARGFFAQVDADPRAVGQRQDDRGTGARRGGRGLDLHPVRDRDGRADRASLRPEQARGAGGGCAGIEQPAEGARRTGAGCACAVRRSGPAAS